MDARLRWSCVTGVMLMLGVGTARGNIANGDFSIPFGDPGVGWQRYPDLPSVPTAEIASGQLHLLVTSTWTWDGSQGDWIGTASYADITQDVLPDTLGFRAPPGTTGLQFDVVDLTITGNVPGNVFTGLNIYVGYRTASSLGVGGVVALDELLPEGSYRRLIDLPDMLPDGDETGIGILAVSWIDPLLLDPAASPYIITLDATLDNFEFVQGVIPEPATLLTGTIAVALIGWVARRRVTGPRA
ncbi:MAG TPA: PEP-CTERM sorting domain-containing protein [Phycisphaerae bacterium]|nr:PEP-CTERM sorting domain-containing protein [Phycisphaerae bacterium]